MLDIDRTVSLVADYLVAAKPTLDRTAVRPDSSLTADLGFDSLDLVELASRLSRQYESVDLLPWITGAMGPGGDRVSSLAAYLLNQIRADPNGGAHAAAQDRRIP
jgi:acyl carrier protein